MFSGNLRIIPMMIFVAILAFSVRLAEVAVGIRALRGEARAEEDKKAEAAHQEDKPAEHAEHKKAPDTEKATHEPEQDELAGSMDKDKKGLLEFPETEGAVEASGQEKHDADKSRQPEKKGEDGINWQSPTDMDIGFSKTRDELGDDLAARREDLERKEKELQSKEALLKAGEQELDRKFQELSQLRGQIEGLLQKQSEEENARIASLVKIYEGMKPADAARIFDTLDLDVLVAVMSRMSERKLSPVMAAMNPERAKTITIMLAEQKQLPRLPETQ